MTKENKSNNNKGVVIIDVYKSNDIEQRKITFNEIMVNLINSKINNDALIFSKGNNS